MKYPRVHIQQVHRSEWRAHIPDADLTVRADTKEQVKLEAFRVVEAISGMKSFQIIWVDF